MWASLLATKDQAATTIKEYQARAEGESKCKLTVLHTNCRGEFNSKDFAEYCATDGVQRQLTAPYSPQQNGVVERWNAMVVEAAQSMLKEKGLPGCFWGESVMAAVYLLNRVPCKVVEGKTLFERWYRKKQSVHHLKTFGCVMFVRNTKPNLKKLEDCG
jgi:transposase InsO family protein